MTGADLATLAVYDARAEDYGVKFASDAPYPRLEAFLDSLAEGGRILDLGCGTGTAAARMRDRGFDVVALDASQGMADEALRLYGLEVLVEDFDALPRLGLFDAVWAHFSLLHATRAALPRHLTDIVASLNIGGRVLVAMKTGHGMARDSIGRRYSYVTQEELTDLLWEAGLTPTDVVTGADEGLDGVVAPWVMVTARA